MCQANLLLLWQASCLWKQKLCWFTKHEQSNSTVLTLQGWCFPGKLGKVADKFCVKHKGYVKLHGRSWIGMLSSRWGAFIQYEVFLGKRIKLTKTSYFKKIKGLDGHQSHIPKPQNSQLLTLAAFLSSVAPSKLWHTNMVFILHAYFLDQENTKKPTRSKFHPEYLKRKTWWRRFAFVFF